MFDFPTGPRLQDKVAIVTGAASGIGATTVELFLAHGARVYALDLDGDSINPEATFIKCNVVEESDWEAAVKQIMAEAGRINVLFNNAGTTAYTPPHEIELEEWDKVMSVNVTGVLLGMKHVAPIMVEQEAGSIINTSSCWGLVGAPGLPAYSAAKGATLNLSRSAALTYAEKGVRVNSIHPGWTDTSMTSAQDEDLNKQVIETTPMKRGGKPEEIAYGALFLASDEATFMTGAALTIDGGLTAQ